MEVIVSLLTSRYGIVHHTTWGFFWERKPRPPVGKDRNARTYACFGLLRQDRRCLTLLGASSKYYFDHATMRHTIRKARDVIPSWVQRICVLYVPWWWWWWWWWCLVFWPRFGGSFVFQSSGEFYTSHFIIFLIEGFYSILRERNKMTWRNAI